jgi:hypothetical protein
MGNLIRKENFSRDIQLVYVAIRKNRPWDTRPAQNMYTTTQEKYLIELIKEGHSIPKEIIEHVVNQCTETHTYPDGRFSCCHGYILTGTESEHLKCKNGFHKLNKHLYCHGGFIYYPVDMLKNAFGDWRPDETHTRHDIQEVYKLIRQKWPSFCNGDDAYRYTLKHLVDLIENGETVHKDVQKHVINGCTDCEHNLDEIFSCSSGYLSFLDRKKDKRYEQNIKKYRTIREKLRHKQSYLLKVKNNSRQNGKLHTIEQRICHRDFICSDSTETILISPQENSLINEIMSKGDVPNYVVSHAVENCSIYEHHLSEAFVCHRGYIIKRCSKFYHRFLFMEQLKEESRSQFLDMSSCDIDRNTLFDENYDENYINIQPYIAPPPPDFLDNNPMHQQEIPYVRHIDQRRNVVDIPNNEGRDVAENPARNIDRHPNLAPPPQEVDV